MLKQAAIRALFNPEDLARILIGIIGVFVAILFFFFPVSALLRIPWAGAADLALYTTAAKEMDDLRRSHPDYLRVCDDNGRTIEACENIDPKYLVAIDAVRFNQDFNKVTTASINQLVNKFDALIFVTTETHSKVISDGYTDELTGEWVDTSWTYYYYVDVYRYITMEEVINSLGFSLEEKALLMEYAIFDFTDFNLDAGPIDLTHITEGTYNWPVPGFTRISSTHGPRIHPVTGKNSFHHGIDIPAPIGTGVYSPADGIVKRVSTSLLAGKKMVVSHPDGFETVYMHLSKFVAKEGQEVKRGDLIALVGNTGRSTGPHLHYETHMKGKEINPLLLYSAGR